MTDVRLLEYSSVKVYNRWRWRWRWRWPRLRGTGRAEGPIRR